MRLLKNLKGRLMVALICIALISIIGFGLAAYLSERGALTESLRDDLTAYADFKQAELIAWLNERQTDARMVAINKSNRDNLAHLIALEDDTEHSKADSNLAIGEPRLLELETRRTLTLI